MGVALAIAVISIGVGICFALRFNQHHWSFLSGLTVGVVCGLAIVFLKRRSSIALSDKRRQ